jgi:phospholipase C
MRAWSWGGFLVVLTLCSPLAGRADGDLHRVKHIIVVMQENHSFDNYLGVLPYVSGTPYHPGPCTDSDHSCVDGLQCTKGANGSLTCTNSNLDDDGNTVTAFHETKLCAASALDHSWIGSHLEGNFTFPNQMLTASPADGFVRQNDLRSGVFGGNRATADETMGYYTPAELPFYYQLAQSFALDDRYFASVIGPSFPNRSYLMAATSFGHLDTRETVPNSAALLSLVYEPYEPVTGTIFDLLDRNDVSWADYSDDVPQGVSFRNFITDSHFRCLSENCALRSFKHSNSFIEDARMGSLPEVAFVDPSFGILCSQHFPSCAPENDEHPPSDIRAGEAFVARVIRAVRTGPNWKDSIIFVTYDENGGYYDHAAPATALQGGASSPDGVQPGLCEDVSNPPASEMPGGGLSCEFSMKDAVALCPMFDPSAGGYPSFCANFDQYGFRVPFLAVSPFSKPHYVSHTVGDHTSVLAIIEKRFLSSGAALQRPHLTARDQFANTLEDMFDFTHSPSLRTTIPTAPIASSADNGCS